MARIVLAWELGGGFGHLRPHAETLRRLRAEGHEIHVVARDLDRVGPALGRIPVHGWQAPFGSARPEPYHRPTRNFAQILHNCGYNVAEPVVYRVSAWRNLLAAIDPDVAIVDYSPAALLALRGTGVPSILVGTGFFVPPDVEPLPRFPTIRPSEEPRALVACEADVLAVMNRCLGKFGSPLLDRVAQLFRSADGVLLQTYPELDHYGPRPGERYVGPSPERGGQAPVWPAGRGPRIFGYLKSFPQIEAVLACLKARRSPTLIAADGIPADVMRRCECETLRIVRPGLDLAAVAERCDAAILNANHATLCRFLLAGKPTLNIPLQLEQETLAYRAAANGLGTALHPSRIADFDAALDRTLGDVAMHGRIGQFRSSRSSGCPDSLGAAARRLLRVSVDA